MDGKYQLDCLEGLRSSEKFLVEYSECREAERQYHALGTGETGCSAQASGKSRKDSDKTQGQGDAKPKSSLACEIANVREKINTFLKNGETRKSEILCESLAERLIACNQQYDDLKLTLQKTTGTLNALAEKFEVITTQLSKLPFKIEVQPNGEVQFICKESSNVNIVATPPKQEVKNSPKVDPVGTKEDDDDIDLFGSDEETEEEAKLKAERLEAYQNKKSKKPALVAKSSVVLDVKPWDDETDMKELEAAVRKIEKDGLKWGAGKLVPLAYGIKKLQIVCIVEDDKVSIDELQENIQEIEDLVQSVDIAAFNKL